MVDEPGRVVASRLRRKGTKAMATRVKGRISNPNCPTYII